ncbi:MAG: hypothetical protein GF329_16430 [Candidatus Lokiarchaeota archaeon]|nr:hypothetical protein [Candidatus Lokiarchaeota archaeon]
MVKINRLNSSSRKVNLVVKILDIEPERQVKSSRSGKVFRVADAKIADESGAMKMTLWEDMINEVSPGDILKITNAYVNEFRGALSLNIGKYGKYKIIDKDSPEAQFEVNEEYVLNPSPKPREPSKQGPSKYVKVKDLEKVSKGINIRFKVIRKDDPRGVNTKRGPQTVCDFLVGDETGCILLSLWNDDVYEIALNSYYEIKKGYTNSYRGILKLNKGRYGVLNNISREDAGFDYVDDSNNLSETLG